MNFGVAFAFATSVSHASPVIAADRKPAALVAEFQP